MRLWSIHPKYLDRQGLLAVWREGLLAQKVLLQGEYKDCSHCEGCLGYEENCSKCKGTGKIKTPYYNHPQLEKFKTKNNDITYIVLYLKEIFKEAINKNYKFRLNLIAPLSMTIKHPKLTVTTGQLVFEISHLLKKLRQRDRKKHIEICNAIEYNKNKIQAHPLFKVINGDIENWEKVK